MLGMFHHLAKFVPNLAAKMQNLFTLLKKNADLVWEEKHTKILKDRGLH